LACLNRLPPTAARLADARPSGLTALGLTKARAESIRALARAVERREVDLSPGPDPEQTAAALAELPGIGPWTADYIAMRALRWPDAFPAGDLGLLRATGLTSARALREAAESWRPWRAYAAVHLWTSH
jgi:AraC family transcriptional regulator of adaptative response / DNA-3-methyladenine glycosylase II